MLNAEVERITLPQPRVPSTEYRVPIPFEFDIELDTVYKIAA